MLAAGLGGKTRVMRLCGMKKNNKNCSLLSICGDGYAVAELLALSDGTN